MKTELPIATGWYEDGTRQIAAQECSNFIVKVPETNAYSRAHLIGTPGIEQRSTAGTKAGRGAHVMNGVVYTVNGTELYRENNDGTTTALGTITGSGRVSMADNGTQLCIVVPGSVGYIFTASPDTLTTITDTNYTTAIGPSEQVVFKDGYFVHYNSTSLAGTGVVFFISNLNNGLVYGALDFGSAEADPDKITGIHVNKNILYVAGEITTEPFQNIGVVAGDFPFQRIGGALIQKGVAAKFSLIDYDNGFAFVGGGENESPAVYRASGGSVSKISTGAVDNELRQLTETQVQAVFCTTDNIGGGNFLNVHLPGKVFSFDSVATALAGKLIWFERTSKDEFGRQTTWRVNDIVTAYGKTIVTDNQSGRIGNLDIDVYTEYGVSIKSTVATQPFTNQGNPLVVSEVELSCAAGYGNIVDPGSDPVVSREYSDDGGFTWSNSTDRSLGKQGEYRKRQIWRGEGMMTHSRVYRFTIDAPVKKAIMKFTADIA